MNTESQSVSSKGKEAVVDVRQTVFSDFAEAFDRSLQQYRTQVGADSRLKLIDIFCLFLVILAGVQCTFLAVVRDTFPFNAFLAGFSICVGQFVLLMSLRMQIVQQFVGISTQRATGEFVIASLVLHFVILHFIN